MDESPAMPPVSATPEPGTTTPPTPQPSAPPEPTPLNPSEPVPASPAEPITPLETPQEPTPQPVPQSPENPTPTASLAPEPPPAPISAQDVQTVTSTPPAPPPTQSKPPEPEPEDTAPAQPPQAEATPVLPKQPAPTDNDLAAKIHSAALKIVEQQRDERLIKANQVRQQRKVYRKERIIQMASQKPVTNFHIRDRLHISRSSAANLTQELVKEGKLKAGGKKPRNTYST